jgi:hypothetical protein
MKLQAVIASPRITYRDVLTTLPGSLGERVGYL